MNINYADIESKLKIHCEQCSGLCCVALFCTKTDGFPANKDAGVPCRHLMENFRCDTHATLASKGLKGCLAYDCFGAGQKVTQDFYPGDWKSCPEKANEIFNVFHIVFQLHQIEWYLLGALAWGTDQKTKSEIDALIRETEQILEQTPTELLDLDVENYRIKVNKTLKQICNAIARLSPIARKDKNYFGKDFKRANLTGADFSMAFLIAANLEGCLLHRANFLGADMRDANIKNTDLSSCFFLTQMQVNSALGNANTKLPSNLALPASWLKA